MDRELLFDLNLKHVAHQTSLRVSAQRKMVNFFEKSNMLFYMAQVRPYLQYGALAWMSSTSTHLKRFDKVEQRVQWLLGDNL